MPKAIKRGIKSPSLGMEVAHTGRDESAGLLKTIDKGLEDIRAVITCRVCVRPLYEPFTIECGHTFCYSCLVSWFEKNTAHKSCPDCRAKITRKPAPAYLVRDITQLFSNRAELLPFGETTKEHQNQQQEEARYLEADKNGRGLFRGCFRHEERSTGAFGNRIIIDNEDGVSRCPRCTWEMEDDMCAGCGWPGTIDSWGPDSELSDEDDFARRAMGIIGSEDGYESSIPSEAISGDEDDAEDDSAGSLDGFVVSDEPGRGYRRGFDPHFIPWGHANSGPGLSARGRTSPPASSNNIPTSEIESDSQASEHTSDGNTDAPSLFGNRSSRSRSADSLRNDTSPNTVQNLTPNAQSWRTLVWLNDSDEDDVIPLPPGARRVGRLRPDRVSSSGSGVNRPNSRDDTRLASDSLACEIRSRPHENRGASTSRAESNYNSNNATRDLTSDDEDLPRSIQQRAVRRNAGPRQAMRRRAARPIVTDEEDEDEGSSAVRFSNQDLDETLRGNPQVGLAQQQMRALPESLTSNVWNSNQNPRDNRPSSRFDPVTSIPVRRDNVNMPGAFPPSFVSEQGQSQSTPPINVGALPSPSLPDRNSASGSTRAPEGDEQAFLDRRRREERTTQATHMQQTRRRERSAAKAARRQERQRVKAEHDARGRRGAEPSAPPLMTL